MKNLVKLEYKNKVYESHNDIHPSFGLILKSLLLDGFYDVWDYTVGLLSIDKNYSVTSELSSVSALYNKSMICAFTNPESALNFVGDPQSSLLSQLHLYPLSVLDMDNNPTYSVSGVDDYSFVVSQSFFHTPTANAVYDTLKIGSFSIKTLYKDQGPFGTAWFNPFAYITSKKLTGQDYIELQPSEFFKLSWVIDFRVDDTTMITSINGMSGTMHKDFLILLKNVLLTQGYTGGLYDGSSFNYQISGIIAFSEPKGALLNDGSTSNNTAFLMKVTDSSLSALSGIDNYSVAYRVSYTNNTPTSKVVGSLLLSGSLTSDVKSIVPISWITAKSLWGVDKKVILPGEKIELFWTVDMNPFRKISVLNSNSSQA